MLRSAPRPTIMWGVRHRNGWWDDGFYNCPMLCIVDRSAGLAPRGRAHQIESLKEGSMHGLIYLIGLIVVILAILSFFGLR